MPNPKNKGASTDALVGIWRLLLTAGVVLTLYFARDVLIPLALAALLAFLLTPLVTLLERWVGRIVSILFVAVLILAAAGGGGWILTSQLVDLAAKLPDYKVNIRTKLRSFQIPGGGVFSRFTQTLDELKKDLPGSETPLEDHTVKVGRPKLPAVLEIEPASSKSNAMELARSILAPVLGPLGTGALVLVLVIFMLLQREDLRSRIIRLVGQNRISSTTRAMDDAGTRVARYLRMLLLVNLCYGIVISVGLALIGVPNAILWGVLAGVLRFVPYIGPWIGAAVPVTLALAVSTGWAMPLCTMGLFALLDIFCGQVVEPWLYGSSTGVSSIALIVAAVFWTWLWGPVGLVLATPLTVCLVVMGRHVSGLTFLSIVLSDDDALTPPEEFYHRLLAVRLNAASDLVDSYIKENSLASAYDSVLVPTLTTIARDHLREALAEDQRAAVQQGIREIVEDLGSDPPRAPKAAANDAITKGRGALPSPGARVFCLPARAERDELAGAMLTQLLRQQGCEAKNLPVQPNLDELIDRVGAGELDAVCISVVAPSTVIHARYLCAKIRARSPELKIVVGLWGATENIAGAAERLRASGADEVVVSLADAVVQLVKFAVPVGDMVSESPIPADEADRLAALAGLHLLETETDVSLERFVKRMKQLFDVPLAWITVLDRQRQAFLAQTGLPANFADGREIPRGDSPCSHAVAANVIVVVEDVARDRRFANNSFLKALEARFYVSLPLHAPNGQPVGTLCLLDRNPRQLTDREKRLLLVIGQEVEEELAKRRAPQLVPAGA